MARSLCLLVLVAFGLDLTTCQETIPKIGLVAETLGKHPLGASANGFCCCSSAPRCATGIQGSPGVGSPGGNPGSPAASIRDGNDDADDQPLNIDIRIANSPPSAAKESLTSECPAGTRPCCYTSPEELNAVVGQCVNTQWVQLPCPQAERLPSGAGGKRCGDRRFSEAANLGPSEASPEEFPWLCLVLDGTDKFIGTCAVVADNAGNDIRGGTAKVITAAHVLQKVKEKDLVKVRVLEHDARQFGPPETERHREFVVRKITPHPDFDPKRLTNDVAVLHVEGRIDLETSNGVNAVCLPNCDNMFDFVFPNGTGTRCWVGGWGKDSSGGTFQPVVRKVDVPLVSNRARCQSALRSALAAKHPQLAERLDLHESELCAGGEEGKDACEGDGGSPLVCQDRNGRWFAVGLVAWGVDCALQDVPGVYANLQFLKSWIDAQQ